MDKKVLPNLSIIENEIGLNFFDKRMIDIRCWKIIKSIITAVNQSHQQNHLKNTRDGATTFNITALSIMTFHITVKNEHTV